MMESVRVLESSSSGYLSGNNNYWSTVEEVSPQASQLSSPYSDPELNDIHRKYQTSGKKSDKKDFLRKGDTGMLSRNCYTASQKSLSSTTSSNISGCSRDSEGDGNSENFCYPDYAITINGNTTNGDITSRGLLNNSNHSKRLGGRKNILREVASPASGLSLSTDSDLDSQFSRLGLSPKQKQIDENGTLDISERNRNRHDSLISTTNTSLSTSSICSNDSAESDFSVEHTRVSTLLDNIDPKRLHSYLKKKAKQKDRTAISALSILLPKNKFDVETTHCVRCHKEFDPKHGEKLCILFHRERDVTKISENETGADFGCERCGTVFRLEGRFEYKRKLNKKQFCGACFIGEHTFRKEDVNYEPEGLAKTCEDHGCIVFYV